MAETKEGLEPLRKNWQRQWQKSLDLWSRFIQLRPPRWCLSVADEKKENLVGSFAMIRLAGHEVVISLRLIRENGLDNFAREIMAHEIGHHVLAPADLTDNARLLARTRAALPGKEHLSSLVANLYTDLLINDRLQRSEQLDMAGVYKALNRRENKDPLWRMYLRIYELLWGLSIGTLAKGTVGDRASADAQLGARLIRVYAKDWLDGAGRFAALCLQYLLEDDGKAATAIVTPLLDQAQAGNGGEIPDGLARLDPEETEGALHPSRDPNLGGMKEDQEDEEGPKKDGKRGKRKTALSSGQDRELIGGEKNDYRSPSEYAELMKSLGVELSTRQIVMKYYRERALPHLIPYPAIRGSRVTDPIFEGNEPWEVGSPAERIDWVESLIKSPHVLPGVTTVQRVFGKAPGGEPEKKPMDLYLGVDCSGSMPNPSARISFPVLAGVIMAISALRARARVMAVLSGEPGEYSSTDGFTFNEQEVLKTLTGYLGTGYAFGIMRLYETFLKREKPRTKTHILIITDGDIFSMLETRHAKGKYGWDVAKEAVDVAGGGGTYVLHRVNMNDSRVPRMEKDGWRVHGLDRWESLVEFARKFSRENYERG